MRRRIITMAITSILAGGSLIGLTATPAYAESWTSNPFFCSGPYTTGGGTSATRGGWVEHYRVNPDNSVQLIRRWDDTAVSEGYSSRSSTNHGAGSQRFSVIAPTISTAAGTYWRCDYIG